MLCSVVLSITTSQILLAFPPTPVYEAAVAGEKLGVGKAKWEKLQMEDSQGIGFWFDGKWGREIENALWLSPNFVSRWLGYWARKELWMPGELDKRYQELIKDLDGKLTFIVRLSGFPKKGLLELTQDQRAQTKELKNLRFIVTSGDAMGPASATLLAHWQSRERQRLDDFRWWCYVPFSEWIAPASQVDKNEPMFPLGEYSADWYLVEAFVIPEMHKNQRFELRILSPGKERIAEFGKGAKNNRDYHIQPFNWSIFNDKKKYKPKSDDAKPD